MQTWTTLATQGAEVVQHYAKAVTDAPSAEANILRPYLDRHNKSNADTELFLGVVGTYAFVRDGALLTFGGAPGVAAVGLLHATIDPLTTYFATQQRDRETRLMEASIRSMTSNQFANYKKLAASAKRSDREKAIAQLTQYTMEVMSLQGVEDDKQAKALSEAAAKLTGGIALENLASLEKVRAQQALSLQEARATAKEVFAQHNALATKVDELAAGLGSLSNSVADLERDVQGLALKSMTAEEREKALATPGFAGLNDEDRKTMLAQASKQAVFDKANDVMNKAAGTMQGLSVLAGMLGNKEAQKTLAQVAQTVQYGQAALSVFAGFATGGPIGGLMALGSVGGMFGGGGGPDPKVMAALTDIKLKLDQVITLQKETLARVARVAEQVALIDTKVDKLSESSREHFATLAQLALKDVYLGCPNALTAIQVTNAGGGVGNLDLELQPEAYVITQFPNDRVKSILSKSTKCADLLAEALEHPRILATANFANPNDVEPLLKQEARLSVRTKALKEYLPTHAGVPEQERPTTFMHMVPATTAKERYAKAVMASSYEYTGREARPCRWMTFRPDECGLLKAPIQEQWTALLRTPDHVNLPVTPYSAARLADYALGMFAQPLIYGKAGDTPAARKKARGILEGAARLLDIAVATASAYEGDLAIEFMVDRLLGPPRLPDPADDKGKCPAGQTLGEGYLGAGEEWIYWQYPDLAERVLRAYMRRMAVHEARPLPTQLPGDSKTRDAINGETDSARLQKVIQVNTDSVTMYEYRRTTSPFDWGSRNPGVVNRQTIARAQRHWLPRAESDWFPDETFTDDDTQLLSHVQFHYVPPGSVRSIKRSPLKERNVANELGEQKGLPETTTDCVTTLRSPVAPKENVRYLRDDKAQRDLELRGGWSLVLAGTVLPLEAAAEITKETVPLSKGLQALLTRRALIEGELASFHELVPTEVKPYVAYGILAEMKSSICPAGREVQFHGAEGQCKKKGSTSENAKKR